MNRSSSKFPLLILLLLLLAGPLQAQSTIKLDADLKAALQTVDTNAFKADIAYLADDKLKGRMPGTFGYQMAAEYVTGRLKGLNLSPAGEDGGWLQQVKLRNAITTRSTLALTDLHSVAFNLRADKYAIYPNPMADSATVSAQIVFVGYGISQPQLYYDDYDGVDVKGKIVLITRGAPDIFPSSVAAHVGNTSTILKTAAQHGAIGVIIAIADTTVKLTKPTKGLYSVMGDDGKVMLSRTYYNEQLRLLASVDNDIFKLMLSNQDKNLNFIMQQLKAGNSQSFAFLHLGVNAAYTCTHRDIISYNVVAKLQGIDPKLKNEYVVHSAHLDHLGIGEPVDGDSIYNGAHDNASGVASVLAIAKAYNSLPVKPKRSILFVLFTGEEMGDLGSGYFAAHPTVPKANIVADVNTDMPTIIAPLLSVTALGAEHSSLSKQVDKAAALLGISVEPDPEPKQVRFVRSDQYSFVLNGIPALHIKYGNKTADGKNNLADLVAVWRKKYYHKPQDDIHGIFDYEAGRQYAQLNFLIGYFVAQDAKRPVWNIGDIFAPTAN